MIAAEPAASRRFMRVSRWGIPELRAPARTLGCPGIAASSRSALGSSEPGAGTKAGGRRSGCGLVIVRSRTRQTALAKAARRY
jgi:hypothetical protein